MDLLAIIKNRINAEQRRQEAPKALQHSLEQTIPPQPEKYVIPYINNNGDLIIPFEADPKYFYWKGGQALESTLNELNVSGALWIKYSSKLARNN